MVAALVDGLAWFDFNRLRRARRLKAQTQAMRAWRDDRLLFNLKLLVDVFAIDTQLASTVQCLHGKRVKAMVDSLIIFLPGSTGCRFKSDGQHLAGA